MKSYYIFIKCRSRKKKSFLQCYSLTNIQKLTPKEYCILRNINNNHSDVMFGCEVPVLCLVILQQQYCISKICVHKLKICGF